jgi:outer membrane protein
MLNRAREALMSENAPDGSTDEQALVKLYMELTGTSETDARGVFMYVCPPEEEKAEPPGGTAKGTPPVGESVKPASTPRVPPGAAALLALACLWISGLQTMAARSPAGTNAFIASPLSLADAVNVALRQNPGIVRAQKDLEAAQGVVVRTRAVALPKVRVGGGYSATEPSNVQTPPVTFPGFVFGNPQSWSSQIQLVQSLYEGGRIASALRVAKLTQQRSMLDYQTAVADAILEVQVAYFGVLLAAQQIVVQEKSVELLRSELADTKRRYDAGTVPRFNVLRAEVELANQQPKLIRARNNFRITKNVLANTLGFNVPKDTLEDIPLTLSDKLEAEPYTINLTTAIALALERRPELAALRKTEALRKEDVVKAKAGYKPSVQAFGGYGVSSSMFSLDLLDDVHGWSTGVQLSWDIFDGFRTKGNVIEATALYERAGVEVEDSGRRIELEVRTAYSRFIEATEVLDSQKKVVEQAEEALRLATARSDAGTGTQLDVLSTRTALTDAQTTQAQALHEYEVARARLERAVGVNIPVLPAQH